MRKKVLISICAMLLVLLFGLNAVIADDFIITDEEETPVAMEVGRSFAYGNGEIEVSKRGEDHISISVMKGSENRQSMAIAFGEKNMDPDTLVEAVSGSAITYDGDYTLFSDVEVRPNGDNTMRLTLTFAVDELAEGTYTAFVPAGYFRVNAAEGEKQLYENSAVTIEVNVCSEKSGMEAPVIKLANNMISWEPVEGAAYYYLLYQEDGEEPRNGHASFAADMSGMTDFLDVRRNFPYQPGSKYTVKVKAYPAHTSDLGGAESEYVLYEKMGNERAAAPDAADFEWLYSETSKDYTIFKNNSEADKNRRYFLRLYGDDREEPIMCFRETGGGYQKDVNTYLEKYEIQNSFYMEVCAVDFSNPDLAASEWVKTETVVFGTKPADKILEEIEKEDLSNLTAEQVDAIAESLLEKSTKDELSQDLMNGDNDSVRKGYENLEAAARKNVEVSDKVAEEVKDVIDASSIKTAGLAINAVSGSSVTLEVKKPEKEIAIPAGYNKSTAVQVDIDAPAITEFKYPVMITMKIPAGLSTRRKIVIFHENEKIYPVINGDGTMTFAVTHFSTFAFVNEAANSSGSSSDSSSDYDSDSDSEETTAVRNNTVPAKQNSGKWVEDANGWWFAYADKSYPVSKWLQINNSWYFFKETGYMAQGWTMIEGKWYYLDAVNGNMLEGWHFLNGKWYYLNPVSGDMAQGWKLINGKWYYLAPVSGECLLNTTTPDGYKVDANGAWIQ